MATKANEALLKAAEDGSFSGVKAALKAGADINFDQPTGPNTSRGTALYSAVGMGRVDIVELLLRKGASLVQRTRASRAPLHEAAIMGRTEVVEVLVHHGATVDIRDGYQTTPIMYACTGGYVDIVRMLIEFGARVDLVDRHDMTALEFCEIAKEHKEWECMELIQEVLEKKQLRCCNPKCGKPGYRSTLKLCARCKLTRYCSRECQKEHWSVGHKKCCGQDEYSGPVPNYMYEMQHRMIDALKETMSETEYGLWKHCVDLCSA